MYILLMWLDVQFERVEEFMGVTLEMAHASFKEQGCRRFEVLRQKEDAAHFVLYAAYNSQQDAQNHFQAEHVKRWDALTVSMLCEPPRTIEYSQLF